MVIRHHIGQPPAVKLQSVAAFHLRQGKPVAVEIKPIMVGASPRPDFIVLAVVGVRH